VAGLKLPELTPVPLYVPPNGVAPLSAKGIALIHTDEFAKQLTTGNEFTVMVNVQVFVQPFPSVKV
jgi:hypothetical protein